MVKVGDHVEYIGVYHPNFPLSGLVEDIDGNGVRVKLDQPITHMMVNVNELALKDEHK